MITLQQVELGVLGTLQVRKDGAPVIIPGAKPRAILTMLGLHGGSVVAADVLVELLWGDNPPRTAGKALQTHISSLRNTLGDGFVLTEGAGWRLSTTEIDASRFKLAAKLGRDAAAAADTSQAVVLYEEALGLWRGVPELPDGLRGTAEKTRWVESHAALVEDRADALLATGRAAEIIGELEAAVSDAPLRERRWGQLMLALYRAGRQGEALGAYRRARALLADELGVDPGPDLRRLEAAIVAQDAALEIAASQHIQTVTRAVTFLLTDIEGSTAAWEADADAMAVALARHDELVEQVVTSRGGRLIKTRGEGDATFSVFERPSGAAAAAIELQDAIAHEPWALGEPMRIRVALHTGEVELRDGDYFGRAVNRAARLRSLAAGGQIVCSGATAELVIDSLPDDVVLADLGMRQLRNLARPEHVFELRLQTDDDAPETPASDVPVERPSLPAVLTGHGPFVGRSHELDRLLSAWQTALAGGMHAVLLAGEPGVGKTRLAGEWSRHAYEQGAIVLYGRCDEDLGAPYQPFAEALRSLMPCLGSSRLGALRGVESLLPLVPGLTDVLPDLSAPSRADADTERYALFDAVVSLLGIASANAPVVLVLDDLHWAAKPTLLLLRHLLRFGEHARVQVVGTYRSTDLDRTHPLAAMLADLHRDGTANRIQLSGLDETDVTAYLAEAGYDDEELARALASVTGGNPFFLIEALRHVDESGGVWDPSTLPQGVREAVSRRLSRLPAETNKALAAAAVVGSRFALDLVEQVVEQDLVDAFDEACKAGIIIEEPGGRYRFNHAIVRQSLLAELASVRRMRLHQRIATTLEDRAGADDELLAELAHHYFECAWAGNAAKAVDYCRRAADQAMARLAYEGAADLYDQALHALDELDDELPDRDDQRAELFIARCEALLAAGDMVTATGAVAQLREAAVDSAGLAAWATCFDGQLSMFIHPERLDEIEAAVGAAADELAGLDDAAGEAKAHTVRAGCLARLGRIGDCEVALDRALTAARRAREHRRVNAVLAGAPLAALWGPNPVSRAGGRCLDVVRLLRITSESPAVEATSTRCQAVLDAFRGRSAAARRMIDSTRRAVTELGLRHALLEVEHFAGIVELVADDPAAAEPHLRRAYDGFRRLGLDADAAEAAALVSRACLALDRDDEADELCSESERLAGHALKPSIAWRSVRAQLLARRGQHDEARRVAEAAVAVAERTDALVDHGDACLALATVLSAAGDTTGATAAAEQAAGLYERKGATALVAKARNLLGDSAVPAAPTVAEAPTDDMDNECLRALRRAEVAFDRKDWDQFERMYAANVVVESRRKVVGFTQDDLPTRNWPREVRRLHDIAGAVQTRMAPIAMRGERLALTRLEVGYTDTSPGAPRDEALVLYGIDEAGRIALHVFFDVEDMDAAVAELDAMHARFEERQPRSPLGNAASRANDRLNALFAERSWDEIGALFADDIRLDDRRRGLRRESADYVSAVAEVRAIAELGVTTITSEILAVRGERLVLGRVRFSGRDQRPEAFHTEVHRIVAIADERIVAVVDFDLDDLDAAFKELDARYLAGEAAQYAEAWQIVVDANDTLNRHEPLPTEWHVTYTDHRRISFGSGDFGRAVEELWTLVPDAHYRATAVHALDTHGAVIDLVIEGTDVHGGEMQWTRILVVARDSGRVRVEVYEGEDLDAALARFDELRPRARLENAASQVVTLFFSHFAARDWDAMAEAFADDVVTDDRRRVVNAGVQHGRDVQVASMRATAELGTIITSTVVATRGDRIVLVRVHSSNRDPRHGEFNAEMFNLIEIDADHRIAAGFLFDLEDLDAAFKELDARYLAGEAAPYAETWQMIMDRLAAVNRHEPGAMSERVVSLADHRHIPFAPDDFEQATDKLWELVPDARYRPTAVHALDSHGAVIDLLIEGTDQDGNELQWVGTDVISFVSGHARVEVYEREDLDAALGRFEELRPRARLENAASRADERFGACYAARDWDAMADMLTDDFSNDDRRRTVNAGLRHGRDTELANLRALVDLGVTNMTSVAIATRGGRLALTRTRISGGDEQTEAFDAEVLQVVEVDADERFVALVIFDLDNIDAAIEELEARYLAGEAAAHAQTWSVIARVKAACNRHELSPTTSDWVNIDHRRGLAFSPGDLTAYLRASWNQIPNLRFHVEAVHRLSNLGAVHTQVLKGISQDGFAAAWRMVEIMTVEGDLINRCEIFDEADIDAAMARFDELSRPAQRLENTASQVYDRLNGYFAARDWAAMAETVANDMIDEDRRRVANSGVRRGRDAVIASLRTAAELGAKHIASSAIATRGDRLALCRLLFSGQGPEAFHTEALGIAEIDADERVVAHVMFDLDDIDLAFEELDARYLAGEAADHANAWSVIAGAFAALNRRQLPATTQDWVNVDHRRGLAIAPGDMTAYIRASLHDASDFRAHIEAVHRITDLGAVVTHSAHGTGVAGFEAEWRVIQIYTVDGDLVDRCEMFEEADLDAALARFEELQPQTPRLGNAASQVAEHFWAHFAANDRAGISAIMAAGIYNEDRRPVVNSGLRQGRDAVIDDMQLRADSGVTQTTPSIIAIRGAQLVLGRIGYTAKDERPDPFVIEILYLIETDADDLVSALVVFDPDDVDAALEELDARYLAGEAATHAHTWSVVASAHTALNRHELPPTTPDWVNIDHRRGAAFASGDLSAYIRTAWDLMPDIRGHIEVVHRLNDLGVVVTHAVVGSTQEGFDAEWRQINLLTVDGDLMNRIELFDEADLDTALAKFDELMAPAPRLENAASGVDERFQACFAARDWAAMGQILADDISAEDRRRVVNSGIRRGRDAKIADMRATADLGTKNATSTVIAIRGQRLALVRIRLSGRDQRPDAFHTEMLGITELNADNRMAARVLFDVDDFDAAVEELDARYLVGEAAAHAHTWSAITSAYAALKRRELPATTTDWVSIDHRRLATIEAGEHRRAANMRAAWDVTPDITFYIEAVHRLGNGGAVITRVANGTSRDGFDAEWRAIDLLTVKGDLFNHCEIFDEADIDTALARFDELSAPAPLLENAASRVDERFGTRFAAREWDAMAEMLADDTSTDDRRRTVNSGIRHGRDPVMASMRAISDVGVTYGTSTVVATRGERLALSHIRMSGRDQGPEASQIEMLGIVEIDADERIVGRVTFDVDNIDAAFDELDARYLAGEAAANASVWSVVAGSFAAINRREFPATTPDWVNIDHRCVATIAPGDFIATTHAGWDLAPNFRTHIGGVHRLSSLGAVVTNKSYGTSRDGFEAEWGMIQLITVDGDLISRCELFDEADLDAALARFDELDRPAPRLENAASQVFERFQTYFAARNWAAMADLLTADTSVDDHRRVVSGESRSGRDLEIANARAVANLGTEKIVSTVIAARGERLALCRTCIFGEDPQPGAFRIELLNIVEIDANNRIAARVGFDLDDLDAAFAELDSRYLGGEAAPHAHTWSVISRAYTALNRREMYPTTTEFVNIDHRHGAAAFAPGDLIAYMHAAWKQIPDLTLRIEAVHRLTHLGAVYTQVLKGTSEEGFAAEWRIVEIMMVEGNLVSRAEIFDETDLDAALAKFDELNRPAPRLENAASQVYERCNVYFAARDWDAMAAMFADDITPEDRRRVVGLGAQRGGREAVIADIRAIADLGMTNVASTVIATRGQRLILTRAHYSGRDQGPGAFRTEMLDVIEIDADDRMVASVVFDPDSIEAAVTELENRYLAGEAAAHAQTWSVIARTYAGFNRGELPRTTDDFVIVGHRHVTTIAAADHIASVRTWWELMPDLNIYIEAVHRLSDIGAVIAWAGHGTVQEGFEAEWRGINVLTADGDRINRSEMFDETDIDAALARFDELNRQAPQLENAASRGYELLRTYFAARDWDSMAEMMADDVVNDDRRRVVNAGIRHGKDAFITLAQATADVGATNISASAVATRGSRLALTRTRTSNAAEGSDGFYTEGLDIVEIDVDERFVARVAFDLDDIDAAYAELENRYLAGEAAAHARTWSVVVGGYATVSRHEMPPSTPDWVNVDHRRGSSFAPGEMDAYMHAAWELTPDIRYRIEAVHRLSDLGAVVTHVSNGTTQAGFDAEWRVINLLTVEGDLFSRCEMFDEADIDAALARFDELNLATPQRENAAIRAWAGMSDAFNRRDADDFLATFSADSRYEDRRMGLRDEGFARTAAPAVLEAPTSWRHELESVAIRGVRLGLTRDTYRDTKEADRPIVGEHLTLIEVGDDGLVRYTILFDPADINGATGELTARWIASGEVAHPDVVEAAQRVLETANRHDWGALAMGNTGATYINHRQLATGSEETIADYISSIRAFASLVPDFWYEPAEILAYSAAGTVTNVVLKGTSAEGVAFEVSLVLIGLFDGGRLTHLESFDLNQRDLALARFDELNRPA